MIFQNKDQKNHKVHIAQTQRILENIRRHNQQGDVTDDDAIKVSKEKKRGGDGDQSRTVKEKKRKIEEDLFKTPTVKKKKTEQDSDVSPPVPMMHASTSFDDSDVPSVLESPPISSTRIENSKTIFMFSQGDEEDDDSVFDL